MGTMLHPTAGYIENVGGNERPGAIYTRGMAYLRDLAKRVREIASHKKQADKRKLWYGHCRLRGVWPMLLVFPEDSWVQIIEPKALALADPYWRRWEWTNSAIA